MHSNKQTMVLTKEQHSNPGNFSNDNTHATLY